MHETRANIVETPPSAPDGERRFLIGLPILRRQPESTRQFARFVVVGLGNTAISFAVYPILLVLGTPYLIAAPIAFAAGAVNGYVFNRRWTFSARDSMRARILYIAVQGAGAGTTSLLVLFFVHVVGTDRVVAYVGAIPPVTVCTFVANRVWTFARQN